MSDTPDEPQPPSSPTRRPADVEGTADPHVGEPPVTVGEATNPERAGDAHPARPGEAEAAGATAAGEGERAKGGLLRETAIVLVTALVLSVLIKTFLVQAFFIPSSSMETTLAVGDRIMVNKIAASTGNIERGDIVVFVDPGGWLPPAGPDTRPVWQQGVSAALTFVGLLPQDAGHHLVKRVIGTEGDRVACCSTDGRLEVNGVAIDEPYVREGTEPSAVEFDVVVPADHLWVMGDNRSNSEDSRAHMGRPGSGFVPLDNVEGRTFVVLWPFDHLGLVSRPDATFADVPDAP